FKHPRFAGNGDKSHEQNKSKNNKQRETSSQRLTWKRVLGKRSRVVLYGLALLLLAGSVGFLESTSSRETILRSDGFATTVRDFGVSLPIRLVGGDELSLSWSSNESASIAIMDPFALQMFNQTGVLTNLINLS